MMQGALALVLAGVLVLVFTYADGESGAYRVGRMLILAGVISAVREWFA